MLTTDIGSNNNAPSECPSGYAYKHTTHCIYLYKSAIGTPNTWVITPCPIDFNSAVTAAATSTGGEHPTDVSWPGGITLTEASSSSSSESNSSSSVSSSQSSSSVSSSQSSSSQSSSSQSSSSESSSSQSSSSESSSSVSSSSESSSSSITVATAICITGSSFSDYNGTYDYYTSHNGKPYWGAYRNNNNDFYHVYWSSYNSRWEFSVNLDDVNPILTAPTSLSGYQPNGNWDNGAFGQIVAALDACPGSSSSQSSSSSSSQSSSSSSEVTGTTTYSDFCISDGDEDLWNSEGSGSYTYPTPTGRYVWNSTSEQYEEEQFQSDGGNKTGSGKRIQLDSSLNTLGYYDWVYVHNNVAVYYAETSQQDGMPWEAEWNYDWAGVVINMGFTAVEGCTSSLSSHSQSSSSNSATGGGAAQLCYTGQPEDSGTYTANGTFSGSGAAVTKYEATINYNGTDYNRVIYYGNPDSTENKWWVGDATSGPGATIDYSQCSNDPTDPVSCGWSVGTMASGGC